MKIHENTLTSMEIQENPRKVQGKSRNLYKNPEQSR
jgi:hypothetical protein